MQPCGCQGHTSDVVERSVLDSAGFCSSGTWLDKHFHATETFGAINEDVSVCVVAFDLYRGWSQRRQLFRHVLKNPLEHGRSTREHDIDEKLFADVYVTLRERSVVESAGFFIGETCLAGVTLHAMETFSADSNEVSVWEPKSLHLIGFRR